MTNKAILLDEINQSAFEVFERADWQVESFPKSISSNELQRMAEDAQVLGVRSGPQVPHELFADNDNLQAIAVFGSGHGHVDSKVAAEQGVAVFNAPRENTRSVAQHVIGVTFNLLRRISEQNMSMHAGVWDKTDKDSHEIQAKTMGIIGYGMIGSKVATALDTLGMDVIYYDLMPKHAAHGRVTEAANMDELLDTADIITIHVDANRLILDAAAFERMKPGSYLINASRSRTVDTDAMIAALNSGQLRGVALDVYDDEPKMRGEPFTHRLQGRDNVIFTSHTGGSTEQAQEETGQKTAARVLDYCLTGNTRDCVNLPEIPMIRIPQGITRLALIHRDQPGALEAVTGPLGDQGLNIEFSTELRKKDSIGYIAFDVEGTVGTDLIATANSQPTTIKLRAMKQYA